MEEKVVESVFENEKQTRKKQIEDICKKVMGVVIPCICIMMVLLLIFKGSKEARSVKSVLKDEGCDVKIYTGSEVSELLEDLELDMMNIDEVVVARDKEDVEVFAFVFFCESRLDAEDAEEEFLWWLYSEPDESYTVERNAKVVCFGYVDLVDAVMEELD